MYDFVPINSRPSFANINSRGSAAQLDARSCNHVSQLGPCMGEIVSTFQVYFSFHTWPLNVKGMQAVCECLRHAGTHIHTHKIPGVAKRQDWVQCTIATLQYRPDTCSFSTDLCLTKLFVPIRTYHLLYKTSAESVGVWVQVHAY